MSSSSFFKDVKRLARWGWKHRPKGKGRIKGVFNWLWEMMNR